MQNSLEVTPKAPRDVKLMNTVTEMGEDRLNMLQYSDVVVASSVSVVVLQLVDNLLGRQSARGSNQTLDPTHPIV